MINDCASVAETLLKYLPSDMEKQLIKRTRGSWNKTLGIAYKILRAHGDIYQANYLLQDCYIASRLGKTPLIGYAVGSDLRVGIKHWLWSRIIKHNLKSCNKIMVSTSDLMDIVKPFRKDAEYLPPPVDPEFFYPKPTAKRAGKKEVLIASNLWWQGKGTHIAVRALGRIKNEINLTIIAQGPDLERTVKLASSLGLNPKILPKIEHKKINEYYWNSDLIIDQFRVGCPGTVAIEAIACNRPAITYVSSELQEYEEFEPKDVNSEVKIVEAARQALKDESTLKSQLRYVSRHHNIESAIKRLGDIYDSVIRN
jgi:glycosyltransferase involved in cell wall biosynthesis